MKKVRKSYLLSSNQTKYFNVWSGYFAFLDLLNSKKKRQVAICRAVQYHGVTLINNQVPYATKQAEASLLNTLPCKHRLYTLQHSFSLKANPMLSLHMLRALGKSKLKKKENNHPLAMEKKRKWEKDDEEELPADVITYPCLPYTHTWNQNLDTYRKSDTQRGLLLFIHSKRVVEISTHEAALVGSSGTWKSQGLHYPACRWPCIWPSSRKDQHLCLR